MYSMVADFLNSPFCMNLLNTRTDDSQSLSTFLQHAEFYQTLQAATTSQFILFHHSGLCYKERLLSYKSAHTPPSFWTGLQREAAGLEQLLLMMTYT